MNHEAALKVQTWVDGELPATAASEVAAWVQGDPFAGALATELRHAQAALRAGEPEYRVPLSRELYWSGIERQIDRRERPQPAGPAAPLLAWMSKFLAPLGILAALTLVLVLPMRRDQLAATSPWASEIESPLDDISSVTFRSESEGITVVWVNTQ
jgi:anti-sigma factor RsiW